MESRRHCREWVVQLLFILDVNKQELPQLFEDFWEDRESAAKGRAFTEQHVTEIYTHISELDEVLKKFSRNWDLHRIGIIERNVIRMSLYEMLFRDDIPAIVSINEAVDIAKYFGNNDSGKFVNGLLDNFRKSRDKPDTSGTGKNAKKKRS